MRRYRVLQIVCLAALLTLAYRVLVHRRDPCASVVAFDSSTSVYPLPKIVHQSWKTNDIPSNFAYWKSRFVVTFPEHEHMMWTDDSMRELVADRYAWFLSTYDAYPVDIMRADAFRYFVLHAYGGLYADMDYEPLVNFWSYLPSDRPAFLESRFPMNERFQNSLMSSPKGHPFWNETFDVIMERAWSRESRSRRNAPRGSIDHFKNVLYTTGPQMLDEAVKRSRYPVRTLRCINFYRPLVGDTILESLWHEFERTIGNLGDCGSPNDERCHFGIHHNTVSWG